MGHTLNIPPFPTRVKGSSKNFQQLLNLFKLEFDENHVFLVYNVFIETVYGFQGCKTLILLRKKNPTQNPRDRVISISFSDGEQVPMLYSSRNESVLGSETHSDLMMRKHKKQIIMKIPYPQSMPESQKTEPSLAEEKIAPCKRAQMDHKREGTRDSNRNLTEIIP